MVVISLEGTHWFWFWREKDIETVNWLCSLNLHRVKKVINSFFVGNLILWSISKWWYNDCFVTCIVICLSIMEDVWLAILPCKWFESNKSTLPMPTWNWTLLPSVPLYINNNLLTRSYSSKPLDVKEVFYAFKFWYILK